MTIAVGDRIPSATLIHKLGEDAQDIDIAAFIAGKRVVLFGLPGAYTGTCSNAHLPSFIRTIDAFKAKGIDDIICVSVNDAIVMQHWAESSGAEAAGIVMLADWDAALTKALGLEFTVPVVGLKDRLTRCAMIINDGVVEVLNIDDQPGVCNLTAGETLLELA